MNAQAPLGSRVRNDLAMLLGAGQALDADTWARENAYLDRVREETSAEVSRHDLVLEEQIRQTRAEAAEKRSAARKLLHAEAEKIAGSFRRTDDEIVFDPQPLPPTAMVVGLDNHEKGKSDGAPCIVPLVGSKGLVLRGAEVFAHDFVESVFARLVATVPLTSLRVSVFDPRMTGLLGLFSDLRNTMGDAFPRSYFDEDSFKRRLEEITHAIAATNDRMRGVGHRNVLDIWEGATPKLVLDVLIIDDHPGTLDGRSHAILERIIARGAQSGVLVLLLQTGERSAGDTTNSFDSTTPEQRDDALSPPGEMTMIEFARVDGTILADVLVGTRWVTVRPVAPVTNRRVQELVRAAVEGSANESGPIVGPERLLPEGPQASSASGLEIVLGERENGTPLTISLRSQNPPLTNALIGGGIGKGKSNLLHTMIYAIAAKYPPAEVDLVLLDFKNGTEFRRYVADTENPVDELRREDWLPHASVVGLESDRHFGRSVLERILTELETRSSVFKRIGVADFDSYRAAGHSMPRLVAIIDEFQTLFQDEDEVAEASVRLLSTIMRQGRAFGIHLVLSTQTLSGIRSLAAQGDAIFAQAQVRIALGLNAIESETMLSAGNRAAATLRFRGEVVVNDNAGEGEENNRFGVVTHAEAGFTKLLQQRLWSAGHGTPPRVFQGAMYAERPVAPAAPRRLALGEEVNVAGTPILHEFGNQPQRTLAIVGSDETSRSALAVSALASACSSGSYPRVVVVGDAQLHSRAQKLAGVDVELIVVEHEHAAPWLVQNAAQLEAAGTFVLVADLQRVYGLHEPVALETPASPAEPDEFEAMFGGGVANTTSAAEVIAGLAASNTSRADLVVSAQLFSSLEPFGYERKGIAAYALADVPLAELRGLLGHTAEAPDTSPRFFYVKAGSGQGAQLGIPYGEHEEEAW